MTETNTDTNYMEMVVDIVGAYVSNNTIESNEIGGIIKAVYVALIHVKEPQAPVEEPPPKATPAQIKKSITHQALISFIDGKPYKTLKRHLTTQGMTVDEYKTRFGAVSLTATCLQ